jgi:glycosyltransferase involved in cell wall biosynthesis
VTFLPWHFDLADDELAEPVSTNAGFVAGGDSLRDYPTLLRAAPAVPARVTIATRAMPRHVTAPPNVTAGPVQRRRYDELLRSATAVVLPLQVRRDRSSGQGTLLNALAHGKTVIVNDAPGVRDYVEDGRTAIVVRSGDADALSSAMRWVLAHPQESAAIAARGRADVLARFSPERYVERVLAAFDALLARR